MESSQKYENYRKSFQRLIFFLLENLIVLIDCNNYKFIFVHYYYSEIIVRIHIDILPNQIISKKISFPLFEFNSR